MGTTPRGPLPPGVYWRRRAFVGLLVVALVFVGVNLLRGGSDGSPGEEPVARQAAGEVEPSHTVTAEPTTPKKNGNKKKRKQQAPSQGPTFDPDVLADPVGTCDAGDILVRPEVEDAVAGRDVTIGLSLQTQQTEACTWQLGPKQVAVKVSDRSGTVWTSQECRDAVPKQEVVIRRAIATVVEVTWDARESEPGCSERRDWLLPGRFRVQAATLGGEPHRTTFELAKPEPRRIEPEPEQRKKKQGKKKQSDDEQGEKPEQQGNRQQQGQAGSA